MKREASCREGDRKKEKGTGRIALDKDLAIKMVGKRG